MLPVKKIYVSTPKWLRCWASMVASLMLIQSMSNQCLRTVPQPIRRFVLSILIDFFKRTLPNSIQRFLLSLFHGFFNRLLNDQPMTLKIQESHGMVHNEFFSASELYLQDKTSPSTRLLRLAQTRRETQSSYHFAHHQEFEDEYQGIELKWKFNSVKGQKQFFELSFDVKHKKMVEGSYLPYVMERFKAMKEETKVVKLHTIKEDGFRIGWIAIKFEHSATFETVAMDPELKGKVLEDLDRFLKGKEFHQRVGKAWKRGYLLYGPPGTGKSSLIAAMANHLKFDIYDLQLTHLKSDKELRRALLETRNKSILVIEDIDCGLELKNREDPTTSTRSSEKDSLDTQTTLSGLLNFIDGLWSSCVEERLIIFTTNHVNKIDPALLRPGRMDMHIHMSYCTYGGFKTLARNYLSIYEDHPVFEEIESLLQNAKVTPAQVAEELMKSEDAEVALPCLITLLKLHSHAEVSLPRLLNDQPMTLKIQESHGMVRNEFFSASELYLQDKTSPSTRLLRIAQTRRETQSSYHFVHDQEFEDEYQGIELKWKFNSVKEQTRFFELSFDVRHKDVVEDSYLLYVMERFKAMKAETKVVKLHTIKADGFRIGWFAIKFEHSATFETVAMDPELKRTVLEDLDRFLKGKEFYQGVGKAWKRGYLLYGPPGTGKSSLIAAMANHLKFDIFDLQLTHLKSDMELRRVLLETRNKSILVIEDIDCGLELKNRKDPTKSTEKDCPTIPITLAGLLNFIDGLWSSCVEERIIVFTTNHVDKLDPALLRPGRMDMHIHMSYCTYGGFKTLARKYLGIYEDHPVFEEIESLLQNAKVTPAQVAEELMKSEDAEVALQCLITLLKQNILINEKGKVKAMA